MEVKIEIDKNSLARVESTFKNIVNGVISAENPLKESAQIVVDQATRNFDDQGYTYGENWSPLSASTRRQRTSLGYPASRPILVRTGTLKRGARIESVSRSKAVIKNNVEYASYHQFGTSKMPKRTILTATDKVKQAIGLVFINYINRLIKK